MGEIIKGTEPKVEPNPELRALEQLKDHPDPQVRTAAETLANSHTRRKRLLTLVQEALSQLRLDMKYLVFDLEATRRERDALQKKLGEK
jgi:hypothetical protein